MAEIQQSAGGSQKTGQQQPAEPEIEIVEEGEQGTTTTQAAPEGEHAGEYDYEPDAGTEEGDARTGHVQQEVTAGEPGDANLSQEQLTARQRRRQREKASRQREQAELSRLRQENAQLVQNQRSLDSRLSNVELSGIDGQIQTLETEVARANTVMKRSMEAQNGDDFVRAQEIRDAFRDRLIKLKGQKDEATRQATVAPQQQMPNGLTPQQVQYARIFTARHPWYDHNARDTTSQGVQQIDNEMIAQGHNPSTPEYWMELERRVRDEFPDKFKEKQGAGQGDPEPEPRPARVNGGNGRGAGPRLPGGGGGGGGAGGGPVKFHLSAARKQALIDLGVYDDPVKRMQHVKSFIAWDKMNAKAGAGK